MFGSNNYTVFARCGNCLRKADYSINKEFSAKEGLKNRECIFCERQELKLISDDEYSKNVDDDDEDEEEW